MHSNRQTASDLVMMVKRALFVRRKFLFLLIPVLVLSAVARQSLLADTQSLGEYQKYVHNYFNSGSMGNWTYIEKPMFPVFFNDSQVEIGKNWSIVCPLRANHTYHVYFYGKWINNSSDPVTDYEVYVYDPFGNMVGYHTQSAGLPPHLGSNVNEPYFVPKCSGNYTFVIRNDPRESKGAEQATFMIIENAECDVWHEQYIVGADSNNEQVFNTSWAYEFCTDSQRIEVWIKVPDTLDMYEARLYLMANPSSNMGTMLCSVPLAWEQGLYGNRSGKFGGYNLDSRGNRGLAFASCEFYGQNMLIQFTSPFAGASLYHLVFIGEAGQGNIEFLVKTEFGNAELQPLTVPLRAYPNNDTVIAYTSNSTQLLNATLEYWIGTSGNASIVPMEIVSNRTCKGVVPGQEAGTSVTYTVRASDVLENVLEVSGSYPTKIPLLLNISLLKNVVSIGDNVTVRGYVTPAVSDLPVTVTFISTNQTKQVQTNTSENGSFVVSYKLKSMGTWTVQAAFAEDALHYGCVSEQLSFRVEEPPILVKYSLYIGGGLGAVAIAGAVLYVKKLKE